jgi:chromatin remodeling complex protein RSC6
MFERYSKRILHILSTCDPDIVSAKQIRKQIEQDYRTDLTGQSVEFEKYITKLFGEMYSSVIENEKVNRKDIINSRERNRNNAEEMLGNHVNVGQYTISTNKDNIQQTKNYISNNQQEINTQLEQVGNLYQNNDSLIISNDAHQLNPGYDREKTFFIKKDQIQIESSSNHSIFDPTLSIPRFIKTYKPKTPAHKVPFSSSPIRIKPLVKPIENATVNIKVKTNKKIKNYDRVPEKNKIMTKDKGIAFIPVKKTNADAIDTSTMASNVIIIEDEKKKRLEKMEDEWDISNDCRNTENTGFQFSTFSDLTNQGTFLDLQSSQVTANSSLDTIISNDEYPPNSKTPDCSIATTSKINPKNQDRTLFNSRKELSIEKKIAIDSFESDNESISSREITPRKKQKIVNVPPTESIPQEQVQYDQIEHHSSFDCTNYSSTTTSRNDTFYEVSPALRKIILQTRATKPNIIQTLWAYIQTNQLLKEQRIHCDSKLKEIFKLDSMTIFDMTHQLEIHIIPEHCSDGSVSLTEDSD